MNEPIKEFDEWAILEVMGHQKFAGRVSSQAVGGASFVRIDVPEVNGRPAFSKLFGCGSIYCITPVAEDVARAMASQLEQQPLKKWDIPEEWRKPRIESSQAVVMTADIDDDDFFIDGDDI